MAWPVACRARTDQGRQSGDHADQHCVLAVVGGGERDRTPGGEVAGDAGGEVGGDMWFGHGFEGADDALVQMLRCGWRQVRAGLLVRRACRSPLLCLTLLKGFA